MLLIKTITGYEFTEEGTFTKKNGHFYINGNSYPESIVKVLKDQEHHDNAEGEFETVDLEV